MEKWEYVTVNAKRIQWKDSEMFSASPQLDKLGEEGWEMINSDGTYLYFKRRKKEQIKKEDPGRVIS
jgi:hypothetical protein